MQQTVRCSKHLTLLEWCIQQWSSNNLQAGCCQNSVEYWKMYMSVPWIYIYIYIQARMYNYIFLCTYYKQVQTSYVQVQHSCTGTNMSVHGSDMSLQFQVLPNPARIWYVPVLVHTGMYHFEVSRTAFYRVRYVLARASTYHLVLPNSVRASCTV